VSADELQSEWRVEDDEFTSVWALDAEKRLSYFLKRATGHGAVWLLRDADGFCATEDESGRRTIPVWPHARYAKACVNGPWRAGTPESVDIDEWVEAWLEKLADDGFLIEAFPTNLDDGVVMTPQQLRASLDAELSQLEAVDRPPR
jgi:hypothetical protein